MRRICSDLMTTDAFLDQSRTRHLDWLKDLIRYSLAAGEETCWDTHQARRLRALGGVNLSSTDQILR